MSEDRSFSEETVGVIDSGVMWGVWEAGCDKRALGRVFGDVGLDRKVVLRGQRAERGEQGRSARGCEPRGDDGCQEAMGRIDGVDVLDRGLCGGDGRLGGFVSVVVRMNVRIHVASSDKGALASGETDVGENIGARGIDGGVISCCRGAMGEGTSHAAVINHASFFGVGEQKFEGKCVFFEPLE